MRDRSPMNGIADMGRIAEALKRAQREREQQGAPVSTDPPRASRISSEPVSRSHENVINESQYTSSRTGSILDAMVLPNLPPVQGPLLDVDGISPEVVMHHEPKSTIAEKYRSVRTRLLTSNPSGSARSIVLTSSQPREGKTITAANMGFSMAELRHLRIAMVDLDFRQRGLTRLFQTEDRPGMTEVLRGEKKLAEVGLRVSKENLFLIPAGRETDADISEVLSGSHVSAMFRELNDRFHYTLIDTPPVNTASDIGLIAPLCHSVIMVIRMNRTPESLLKRSVKLLKANHVNIAGCILAGYDDATMGYTDPHDYYEQEA